MTKSKLVGERLKSILLDMSSKDWMCNGDVDTRVSNVREAHTAILALFKSIMPEEEEEISIPPLHDYEDGQIEGWNAYRAELLRRYEA